MKVSDQIIEKLEKMIISGDLQNDDKLDEASLAAMFGVSRTPVREALQKLSNTDLVEHIPNRGVFVRQPNTADLYEMFEAMAEFEATCGGLAALRISKSSIENLRHFNGLCKAAVQADDSNAYYAANEKFHMLIYSESGNRILAKTASNLHKRLQPFRRMQLQLRGRMTQSLSEHEAVLDALIAGDRDRAAAVLRGHVSVQGEKFHMLISMSHSSAIVSG